MAALEERETFDDGANYGEAVMWAYWLDVFTPDLLADSMMISEELAERFCIGLVFNGTCKDCGEGVYELIPLPAGPSIHLTLTPPEMDRRIGVYSEAPARGYPVPGTAGSQTRKAARVHRSRVG